MSLSLERMSLSSAEQPDDSGAESWSLLSLSTNNKELHCSICMNLMEKPHLVNCGHSYCFACITQWLGNSSECPTCRQFIDTPMRNIALDNVIEEYRKYCNNPKIGIAENWRRGILKTAHRVSSDDVVPLNTELSPSVQLTSRQLMNIGSRKKISVNKAVRIHRPAIESSSDGESSFLSVGEADNTVSDCGRDFVQGKKQESDTSLRPRQFERFSFGRRTEFVPRRRKGSMLVTNSTPSDVNESDCYSDVSPSPFQRSSKFRHSIGTTNCRENTSIANPTTEQEKDVGNINGVFSKKRISSMFKKLVPFRISFRSSKKCPASERNNFDHPLNEIPEINDDFSRLNKRLCVYSGVGKKFTRMYAGKETTVVVIGKKGVGKTTFLDNIAISIENNRGSASMVGQPQRLSWGAENGRNAGVMAHMMSLMVPLEEKCVIDIIDTDDGDEDTLKNLMKAADVVVVIYSVADASSLLRLMGALRLADRKHGNPLDIVVIGNIFANSQQRVVRLEMVKAITTNLNYSKALCYETDLDKPNTDVVKILHDIVKCFIGKRGVNTSSLGEVFVC